jgi:hypothetical protein
MSVDSECAETAIALWNDRAERLEVHEMAARSTRGKGAKPFKGAYGIMTAGRPPLVLRLSTSYISRPNTHATIAFHPESIRRGICDERLGI